MLLTNGRGIFKDVSGEKEKQLKALGWVELKKPKPKAPDVPEAPAKAEDVKKEKQAPTKDAKKGK